MGATWHTTKHPGVRYRMHPTRKHGIQYDRYFAIRYQRDGLRKEEGLGWTSDGWSAEKAANELAELKKSHILGAGPVRLNKKRQLKKEQEKKEEIEGLNFGTFFKDTYLPLSKQHKKELSWKREEQHFRLWIKPVLESLPLRQIVPLNLEKIKNNMMKAQQSPRSIQYCFSTIRSVWNMARRDGIVQADSPTRQVKIPKFDNRRQRYLTQDECERLLEGLKRYCQFNCVKF